MVLAAVVRPLSPPVLRTRSDKPLFLFESLTQLEKTTRHFNTDIGICLVLSDQPAELRGRGAIKARRLRAASPMPF